jgi:hypothetical protein
MRSIAVRAGSPRGVTRLFLKREPAVSNSACSTGLVARRSLHAPTGRGARRFDIQKTKELRLQTSSAKHVKFEPARWYYHADRLGMLVWQDMPSADNKGPTRSNFTASCSA